MKQRLNSSVLMQNSVSRKSKAKLIIHVSSLPWRTVVVTSVVETGGLVRIQERMNGDKLLMRTCSRSLITMTPIIKWNQNRKGCLEANENIYNRIALKLVFTSSTHSIWPAFSKCVNLNGKNTKSCKSMFSFCHHIVFCVDCYKKCNKSILYSNGNTKKIWEKSTRLKTLWKQCARYE